MTPAESLANLIKNDERNIRDLARCFDSYERGAMVIADCAAHFIEAKDLDLDDQAEANAEVNLRTALKYFWMR